MRCQASFRRWRRGVDPEPGSAETCSRGDSRCGYRAPSAHARERAGASGRGSDDRRRPSGCCPRRSTRMQAKGYGLPAIAELLSDNGIAVTATTLKTYLSEARAAGGRKKPPQGQDAADPSGPELRRRVRRPNRSRAVEAHAASGDAQPGARGVAKAAPAATTPAAPAAPAAAPKATARPSDDAERTAVGLRAEGGHEGHLRAGHRVRPRRRAADGTKEVLAMTEGNGAGRIYWVGGSKGGVGKSMMTVAMLDHLLEQGTQGAPGRVRHVEPGRLEGVPGAGRDGAHQPRRGGRLDPPRQHVRPAPRRGRGDQHGGAQQPRGQAVRTHARQQPGGAREPARGALGDQPAARQPGALARVHRRRPEGRRARRAQRLLRRREEVRALQRIRRSARRWRAAEASRSRCPDLADRVADDIYVRRISLKVAAKELPIGNRAELGRWRGEVRKVLAGVLS